MLDMLHHFKPDPRASLARRVPHAQPWAATRKIDCVADYRPDSSRKRGKTVAARLIWTSCLASVMSPRKNVKAFFELPKQ